VRIIVNEDYFAPQPFLSQPFLVPTPKFSFMTSATTYTWTTYQLYMMGLSISLFGLLILTEIVLRRFDVLHVIYNQMLKLKHRKLIFFNSIDITENHVIIGPCFMVTRLTVILCICYLWQFCVIESYSSTDSGFPTKYCSETDFYCFQTELEWSAFMRASDMTPINCTAGESAFVPVAPKILVSCFRLFNQNAPNWIQNLAIANALGLLMSRVFEILVWVCVQSILMMVVLILFGILLLVALILGAVSGTFTSFVNSWLGFIAIAICPIFIYFLREVAIEVRRIRRQEAGRIQEKTKADLKSVGEKFLATTSPLSPRLTTISKQASLASAVSQDSIRQRSRN
jgi:hypothetical protein